MDSTGSCGQDFVIGLFQQFGLMFYLIQPTSSTFSSPYDIPNYELEIWPVFATLLFIEQLVHWFRGSDPTKLANTILNLGSGLLVAITRVLLLAIIIKTMYYFHYNYHLFCLSSSTDTWFVCLILNDFVYYWSHRSLHRIHLLWASHQFHHSQWPDTDMSTGHRRTVIDFIICDMMTIPLSLIIPPPILLAHMQFGRIYQIWLHTGLVPGLGRLEYLINTPRQHRTHHRSISSGQSGNYGGLLIIWDRMFGTYIHPIARDATGITCSGITYNVIALQCSYYYKVLWRELTMVSGVPNKIKTLLSKPEFVKVPNKIIFSPIAPLVEIVRCILYYPFDKYLVSRWVETSMPGHLIPVTEGYSQSYHTLLPKVTDNSNRQSNRRLLYITAMDSTGSCGQNFVTGLFHQFGLIFYLIQPGSSTFNSPYDIPNYELEVWPVFATLLFVEQMIYWFRGSAPTKLTNTILNLGSGLLVAITRVLLLEIVIKTMYYFHFNYHMFCLSSSTDTWFVCLILNDFVYYWSHRSLHRIHILWASHQFHHSQWPDTDMSTGHRRSVIDFIICDMMAIPLSLIIPPPILLAHMQFGRIYQIWLHTGVVPGLGRLEYLINTPLQHRAHHRSISSGQSGNYGGLLMIWDRMFGTYIHTITRDVNGITCSGITYNVIALQCSYYYKVLCSKLTMGTVRVTIRFYQK
ncbi:unnamed protein product [Medioppia subpectinata]|uniref:Fatty acid hydroxylase domain-containing protein n=1 Tax=Medioppia subpectinata TaxID=1979941 RepID=A0A7R9KSC9_9ACAR|nr:unnamed protein product [Medioppia subpectinata]CAG2107572.1 unnamed protein product [Medioppia subpectinata]